MMRGAITQVRNVIGIRNGSDRRGRPGPGHPRDPAIGSDCARFEGISGAIGIGRMF
jgi:hypothetical protein